MGTSHLCVCVGPERPYLKLFLFAAGILSEEGWEESLVSRLSLNFLGFSSVSDPSLPPCLVSPSPECLWFNFFRLNFLSSIRMRLR